MLLHVGDYRVNELFIEFVDVLHVLFIYIYICVSFREYIFISSIFHYSFGNVSLPCLGDDEELPRRPFVYSVYPFSCIYIYIFSFWRSLPSHWFGLISFPYSTKLLVLVIYRFNLANLPMFVRFSFSLYIRILIYL